MDRLDAVNIWSLIDPPASEIEKIQTSTLVPRTSTTLGTTTASALEVETLASQSLASAIQPDMKMMPYINNVEVELYEHNSLSFNNELWVQFVIITGVAFVVIFIIIFIAVLAAYTLPSRGSLAVAAPASRRRTDNNEQTELNPMLTSGANNNV